MHCALDAVGVALSKEQYDCVLDWVGRRLDAVPPVPLLAALLQHDEQDRAPCFNMYK